MHSVRIERNGDIPLEFSGEELGYATSESPGKKRWFEVTIYRTSTDRYVVHGVGMSRVAGEDDRHWGIVCDSGHDVVDSLFRVSESGRYLPTTSAQALVDASARDGSIRDACVLTV